VTDEQPSEVQHEVTNRELVILATCPECGHRHEVKLTLMSVPRGMAN
jgi:hypothetical protein